METKKEKKGADWINMGFYGGLQRATVVLFGMLTTMILAHKAIEPAEMGVWSLFLVIAAFVEIMRHGLVKNSVIKYLNSSGTDEKVMVLSSALVLNTFITILLGIILYAGASGIVRYTKAPALESMIYWYATALLSLIPFSHFEWLMLAKLNFKALFWTYVVRQSVTLVLLLFMLVFHLDVTLNELVVFYAAGILAGAVAAYFWNRSLVSFKFVFSIEWIKKLWKFGQYAFGTGLCNLVFRSTDTFMVSNILSSTAIVAQQGIALRVFNMADIPSQLIGDILFPKSAGLSPDNKQRIKYYYEKSVGATLAIILPAILFVLIFPQILILILAGPKYLAAVPYLRLLMLISLFLCFLKQFGTIIDSTGRPKSNFLFTSVLAIVNLGSCFFFIKHFGLLGAAYGLLATHAVAFVVSQSLLYRLFHIQFFNSFRYAFQFYPEIGRMIQTKIFRR
ncbi:MAG TPA: oligosaccharide flippase family protein [Flavisolibacter sp.]|jgi:O-antigen/teichoic acid export membrane protein|nr:oligosaccharide flippase family protein [Flavisolibacter sp.]